MSLLPTVYDYYTAGGITAGLSVAQPHFTLNDRNISIYSGAMHYFRVHPDQWRDRLRKIRACGLNTVETYIPWNLHEPESGDFDFGNGTSEWSEFLDVQKFLKMAQEEDLLAIVRTGPFISAEWEFGGFPSWFAREDGMKLRESDERYLGFVGRFFKALMSVLITLQFSYGGPIIMWQIENEYGNTGKKDKNYLENLKNFLEENGATELLFTTDSPSRGTTGALEGVFQTANFGNYPQDHLDQMLEIQPNKPLMVMEYWSGWFDVWTDLHHTKGSGTITRELEIIINYPASFNLYMFEGGTNFGFMNGVSTAPDGGLAPITSSYDYDAPLTEAGDYTDKYWAVRKLLQDTSPVTFTPEPPELKNRIKYPDTKITNTIKITEILQQLQSTTNRELISMEHLDINNNSGQGYGYIVYRSTQLDIPSNSILKIFGRVHDTISVVINGELKSKGTLTDVSELDGFGFWRIEDGTLELGPNNYTKATLDLIVENSGRDHYGQLQPKGIYEGDVTINDRNILGWEIFPLEFKKSFFESIKDSWNDATFEAGPALYRAVFNVDEVADTFLDMSDWTHGFVAVNGFVVSRHWRFGPQRGAYVPGALLKVGENEVVVYEHFVPDSLVKFSEDMVFQTDT